uniref:YqaJ viral recombinase domain-containing protein n=1 Tax=Nothobranchius rachovii TaxID=451742 RepID=A0A1A8P6V8_9TELE
MLNCTEGEQQWHKPRVMGIKPGPVEKMVVLSAKPKTRTTTEGVRSKLYKGLHGDLPDLSVLRVSEVYQPFSDADRPMICSMGIGKDIPLVYSLFGNVQQGSPLSYQQPPKEKVKTLHNAPPPPPLPLQDYRLKPSECMFVCSRKQQLHMKSLEVTLEMSQSIECATREQSVRADWHNARRPQVTASRFREICHVGELSEELLAERILKGTCQTGPMKTGLELEADAIWEYCQIKHVNHYKCGFVVHPDAPWIGASPDGIIFDPLGQPQFGLLEIKCPNIKKYVDTPYLKVISGTLQLKPSHAYYWQVQGQLLTTGMSWCDFVVSAQEDVFIQRIQRDEGVMETMKCKIDMFYFHVFMDKFLALSNG